MTPRPGDELRLDEVEFREKKSPRLSRLAGAKEANGNTTYKEDIRIIVDPDTLIIQRFEWFLDGVMVEWEELDEVRINIDLPPGAFRF